MISADELFPREDGDSVTFWRRLVESEIGNGKNLLFDAALAEMERRILPLVMARCGGSQVKASRALGITRGSLRKKLRQHGFLARSPATAMRTSQAYSRYPSMPRERS